MTNANRETGESELIYHADGSLELRSDDAGEWIETDDPVEIRP